MRGFGVWILTFLLVGMSLPAAADAENEAQPFVIEVEAGPIWNSKHAKERCREAIREWEKENWPREAKWTGDWATTAPGESSVCFCETYSEDVEVLELETGVIEDDHQALERCEEAVAVWEAKNPGREIYWDGEWKTDAAGVNSVCICEATLDAETVRRRAEQEIRTVVSSLDVAFPGVPFLEIGGIVLKTVDADGEIRETRLPALLPRQSLSVTLSEVVALRSAEFDLHAGTMVFDNLSRMPVAGKGAVTMDFDGNLDGDPEPRLRFRWRNGEESVFVGELTTYLDESEKSDALSFEDVVDAGGMAKLRRLHPGKIVEVDGREYFWLEYDWDAWSAFAEEGPTVTDGRESAGFSRIIMRRFIPHEYVRFAADRFFEEGYRPFSATLERMAPPERDGMRISRIDYAGVEKTEAEERVADLLGQATSPLEETPTQVHILLVAEETFEESAAGTALSRRPCFILRKSNSLLLELIYVADVRTAMQ